MRPLIITFSGIDGAGKSTQIQKLTEYLSANGIAVRELTFWDNVVVFSRLRSGFSRRVLQSDGSVGTPERPAERRDKNTQALPLLLGRSLLYLLDLAHLRSLIRRMESEGTGVIIFDRYIYDQLAALPMTSSIVRTYARLVLRLAPKPDLSVVLDAMPEAARARKPEYPLEFMKSYRSSYLRLCDLADLQLIPAGTVEDVHQAILSRAATCIANSAPAPEISSTVIA